MPTYPLSFLKGLTIAADWMTTPPGFLWVMDDWLIEYGRLRPRDGSTILNSAALTGLSSLTSIIFYRDKNSAGGGVFLVQGPQKIYRSAQYTSDTQFLTNLGVAFTDVTGTASIGTATVSMMDILNNIVILTSSSGAINQITSDSTNAAPLAGSPPSATFVKVVNNFAFLAGVLNYGTNSSRIWWSAVGDPQTWPATSFLDWRTNDGDYITALSSIGQDLIVFKNSHIGRLSTTTLTISGAVTLGPMTTLFNGMGCAGYQAVDNLPDGRIVFLGIDYNLWVTDGVSLQMLSKGPYGTANVYNTGGSGPQPQNRGLYFYSANNSAFTNSPIVIVDPIRNEVWVTPYNGSTIFVYDYLQDYWRRITGYHLTCAARLPPSRGGAFSSSASTLGWRLFGGASSANVIAVSNEASGFGPGRPTDQTGATVTAKAIFSIADPDILANNRFRAVNIPANNLGLASTVVQFGFDGTITGPTTTLNSHVMRNSIPIPYRTEFLSQTRYSSLQIQLTDTIPGDLIYTPYLSDEAMS